MGATGTGKSALAMVIAAAAETSIVSCDSMQVYRGLDIGTAKPTAEERSRIPHHLIDCIDLPGVYSAARWAADARRLIAAENAAGRIPLIVGGTGLYLRALLEGLAGIPPEDASVRQRLRRELAEQGIEALHARLEGLDPDTAARLAPTDTQRILRALGVVESSDRPMSAWLAEGREAAAISCPLFVLQVPRELLRQRLAERFHAMLAAGWMDEVRWLACQRLPETHPAVRAVGYRQLLRHVRGTCALDEAVAAGIAATRHYAKRQQTWFAHQLQDAIHGSADAVKPQLLAALAT